MHTGPIISGGQAPTTAGIGDYRSKESMPTSVGVGSHPAIAYGKRWYVAMVTDVQNGVIGVTYATSCRGKWKWGRTEPCAVGNLVQVKTKEKDVVDRLFSSISVYLIPYH